MHIQEAKIFPPDSGDQRALNTYKPGVPYFLLLFFCRFFLNERFFTVYLLRVLAFFVEILEMNGKKLGTPGVGV